MGDDVPSHELLRLSAEIVSAHLARNTLPANELPDLIRSVYAALGQTGATDQSNPAPQEPAVPIRKSVFPDYLVCLEDGKKLKMLKRYLHTYYNMTPAQYRAKWHLPSSYPMVAPNYSAHRSGLAKQLGLGRKAVVRVEPEVPVQKIPLGVRGRKPKSKKSQPAEPAAAASS